MVRQGLHRMIATAISVAGMFVVLGASTGPPSLRPDDPVRSASGFDAVAEIRSCTASDPPVYYAIKLITTRKVPGTRIATGTGNLLFAPSPFGVSISQTGTYVYSLDIKLEKMAAPKNGVYAIWLTTPSLDQIRLLGTLDESMHVAGTVEWNKFLVVVTLEPETPTPADTWKGPIALRGMSRSGLMHTMAGHGPFQVEPCASYGYN